jgi:hypothetical protein
MFPQLSTVALLALSVLTATLEGMPNTFSKNTTLLYQFPNGTWIENIAVRSNNQLLLTLLSTPDLYAFDPSMPNSKPALIHTFSNATAVFGIAEYEPDVFAVSVGNYTFRAGATYGTFAMYKVDFSTCADNSTAKPSVSLIAPVPQAGLINGICALPNDPGALLLGDINKGQVYRLDTHTAEVSIAIPPTNPLVAIANGTFGNVGVNGIHPLGHFLYALNTGSGVYGKITITSEGTPVPGTHPVIISHAANGTNWDDFALDRHGNAYAVTSSGNTVVKITPDGKQILLAGHANSTEIAEPTSAALSRGDIDEKKLYVVTGGGALGPINGAEIVGGQVVAIDL